MSNFPWNSSGGLTSLESQVDFCHYPTWSTEASEESQGHVKASIRHLCSTAVCSRKMAQVTKRPKAQRLCFPAEFHCSTAPRHPAAESRALRPSSPSLLLPSKTSVMVLLTQKASARAWASKSWEDFVASCAESNMQSISFVSTTLPQCGPLRRPSLEALVAKLLASLCHRVVDPQGVDESLHNWHVWGSAIAGCWLHFGFRQPNKSRSTSKHFHLGSFVVQDSFQMKHDTMISRVSRFPVCILPRTPSGLIPLRLAQVCQHLSRWWNAVNLIFFDKNCHTIPLPHPNIPTTISANFLSRFSWGHFCGAFS